MAANGNTGWERKSRCNPRTSTRGQRRHDLEDELEAEDDLDEDDELEIEDVDLDEDLEDGDLDAEVEDDDERIL